MIDFRTHPDRYRHWTIEIDGPVATLALAVDEKGGLDDGYELKLNSYDLGVDIELHDAVQRLRFEHPEVGAVVIRSARDKVFCAGANIRMLGRASHARKVNFCKFTNETRLAIEDATANSRQTYLCAIDGAAAGGGYELAMATDYIILVDDGSTAVSLPEAPLLAVLPGTGGLTRLVDKRRVRRDRADFFCTTEEGVRGRRAVDWGLVDELAPASRFAEAVAARAAALAANGSRPRAGEGIVLTELERTIDSDRIAYADLACEIDRDRGRRNRHPAGTARRRARRRGGGAGPWRRLLAAGAGPPARRSRPASARQRERGRHHRGAHERRWRGGAGLRRVPAGASRRLAGARGAAVVEAHPQARRRHRAQPDRPGGARRLLRRSAAGARPGGGSQLHARRNGSRATTGRRPRSA